jgi:hypothetical protein
MPLSNPMKRQLCEYILAEEGPCGALLNVPGTSLIANAYAKGEITREDIEDVIVEARKILLARFEGP